MAAGSRLAAAARQGAAVAAAASRAYGSLTVEATSAVRGPPGRHSISGVRATVFGSTGFLGRYIVNQLGRVGSTVSLPTRCTDNDRQHLKVMGDLGQVVLWDAPHDFIHKDDVIRKAIGDSNLVINLLGRDFETGNFRFEDVNIDAAQRIARISAQQGVKRLIHFSALGASADAPSKQLRTKAAGEDAVKAAFPDATIVRPAPVVGSEDRLLRSVASMSKLLPFIPLIDGGYTKMAPVEVRDVAAAVNEMILDDNTAGKTYTLGGPQVYTWAQLVELVFHTIREPPRTLYTPAPLLVAAAMPREWLQSQVSFPIPVLPSSLYTSDNVKAMATDYVVPPGALGFESLGVKPRKLEGITLDYLRAFRAGGYAYGTEAGVM